MKPLRDKLRERRCPSGRISINEAFWDTVTLRAGGKHRADLVRGSWMKNISMGDILPGIMSKVERRQGGVVQMFLPDVLQAVDHPPTCNISDQHASVLAGQLY
jgi:hypothetical protein